MVLGMTLLFTFRKSVLFCRKCTRTHMCTVCIVGIVGATMVIVGQLSLLFTTAALTSFCSYCIGMGKSHTNSQGLFGENETLRRPC